MRPSRLTETTIPSFGESGRASARGSSTSTPPCIIGAVIMKMISSTSITSTSEVTLTSALRGISPRSPPIPPMPPAMLEQPFPSHRADQLVGEPLELADEEPDPIDVQVVRDDGGNRRREAGKGGHQGLCDTRSHGGQIPRALGRDAGEGVDDTEGGTEQAQQGTHRPDRGQPG